MARVLIVFALCLALQGCALTGDMWSKALGPAERVWSTAMVVEEVRHAPEKAALALRYFYRADDRRVDLPPRGWLLLSDRGSAQRVGRELLARELPCGFIEVLSRRRGKKHALRAWLIYPRNPGGEVPVWSYWNVRPLAAGPGPEFQPVAWRPATATVSAWFRHSRATLVTNAVLLTPFMGIADAGVAMGQKMCESFFESLFETALDSAVDAAVDGISSLGKSRDRPRREEPERQPRLRPRTGPQRRRRGSRAPR